MTLAICNCAEGLDDGEASAIVELLALGPGQSVADVGAGDGEWTEVLAHRVGREGVVWATEVDDELVEEMLMRFEASAEEEARASIHVVLGDQAGLGLPSECCDAILLRLVYHHFEAPEPMQRDLLAALRPGGRLLVIEIEPQEDWAELDGVPDRGGHGIPLDALVAELTAAGFSEVTRRTGWDGDEERYAVLFEVP
ncbi:MAG: methyltransferase domain-containing protein [Acidobacteriota bacterium]